MGNKGREYRQPMPFRLAKKLEKAYEKHGELKRIWESSEGLHYKTFLSMVKDKEATPTNIKRIEKALAKRAKTA